MNYLEKFIIEQNKKSEDIIRKAFPMPFEEVKDEIIKAKRAQIGEVREWGGVKMRKEANGWVPVKGEAGKPKGEEAPGKEGEETPSIEEHAKKASEAALQNAIKNSPDPEVRSVAYRELERRNREEKSEMFTRPNSDSLKKSLYDFLEYQNEEISKSHINQFASSEEFLIGKTGRELKDKFQYQFKLELEEVKENNKKALEFLTEAGSKPDREFGDLYYWMIDGYEDKLQMLPMVFMDSEGNDAKSMYNEYVSRIVAGYIEMLQLKTMINNLKDDKTYKLNVNQATMLGF